MPNYTEIGQNSRENGRMWWNVILIYITSLSEMWFGLERPPTFNTLPSTLKILYLHIIRQHLWVECDWSNGAYGRLMVEFGRLTTHVGWDGRHITVKHSNLCYHQKYLYCFYICCIYIIYCIRKGTQKFDLFRH